MLAHCLVVAAVIAASDSQTPPAAVDDDFGCAHAKTAARLWAGPPPAPPGSAAGLADTDMLHYFLDIEVDVAAEWIGGSNTMTIRSTVDGLGEFRFRLDDVFDITDLRLDGDSAAWNRIDGETIAVPLDPPYDTDAVFEIFVAYDGFPQGGAFGSIEFRTRSGGHPESWTLSEPWFSYTWWPSKDDNTDKSTADLWFTVDDALVVASNGLLQGVDDLGGKLRYRWKTDYQTVDYLYCFGITDYIIDSLQWSYDGGSMPVDLYVYPEDFGDHTTWHKNLDMLDVFSAAYGLYPFVDEKYGMCQVGFGGGMEHQTMTSQGGFWESITAHELAHQWWGDMVTCATWHDIWLNEGFATFSEAVWYGDRPGGTMADYHNRMDQRRPGDVDDSVYVYDISNVWRIFDGDFTYRKAAWVVHMLRHVLGDETFFDALDAYRAAYEFDSATTEDLRAVVEGVTGRDLEWFFEEWIYDIGAPAYRRAWRAHSVAGRDYLELYLQQVQSQDYPTFIMPLDVVTSGGGGDELHVIWNDERAEHLLFETDGAVSSLDLDPEDWTLHTSNSSTSFVEGPPKVVLTAPAPGAVIEDPADLEIEITLHKDVVAAPEHFVLAGNTSGPRPFVFGYDAQTFTVTITPQETLSSDEYTLTIDDAIVDVAAGRALDGEVGDPIDPSALPSGDGLPGGAAIVRFVVAATDGDVDGDGDVDFDDLLLLLGAWGPCEGDCPADFDEDGDVDFEDLLTVLANWS